MASQSVSLSNQKRPFLTLLQGQFAQHHVDRRITEIYIYNHRDVEFVTEDGRFLSSVQVDFPYPLEVMNPSDIFWEATQFLGCEEYRLRGFIRGPGGGGGQSKEYDAFRTDLASGKLQSSQLRHLLAKGLDPNKVLFRYDGLYSSHNGSQPFLYWLCGRSLDDQNSLRKYKWNAQQHERWVCEMAQVLIRGKVKVNVRPTERRGFNDETIEIGEPILIHVIKGTGYVGVARLLIENGVDLNARSTVGRTALEVAIQYGHGEIVRLLLQKRMKRCPSYLYDAIAHGYLWGRCGEVISVLLANGFDPNKTLMDLPKASLVFPDYAVPKTPLEFACEHTRSISGTVYETKEEVIIALLKGKATPTEIDGSFLSVAARKKWMKVLTLLASSFSYPRDKEALKEVICASQGELALGFLNTAIKSSLESNGMAAFVDFLMEIPSLTEEMLMLVLQSCPALPQTSRPLLPYCASKNWPKAVAHLASTFSYPRDREVLLQTINHSMEQLALVFLQQAKQSLDPTGIAALLDYISESPSVTEEMILLLLQDSASVPQTSRSILLIAVRKKWTKVLDLLAPAFSYPRDKEAYVQAVKDSMEVGVKALLKAGANPKELDSQGTPVLHLSFKAENQPLFLALLQHGADVDCVDPNDNLTCLGKLCRGTGWEKYQGARKHWMSLMINNRADARKVPRDIFLALSSELQLLCTSPSFIAELNQPTVTKVMNDLQGQQYNRLDQAKKLEELKAIISNTLTTSQTFISFINDADPGVILKRRVLAERFVRKIDNLLIRNDCFNPEKQFLNSELITKELQMVISEWRAEENLTALEIDRARQQQLNEEAERQREAEARQKILTEQAELQRKALEQQQKALEQQAYALQQQQAIESENQKRAKEQAQQLAGLQNSVNTSNSWAYHNWLKN